MKRERKHSPENQINHFTDGSDLTLALLSWEVVNKERKRFRWRLNGTRCVYEWVRKSWTIRRNGLDQGGGETLENEDGFFFFWYANRFWYAENEDGATNLKGRWNDDAISLLIRVNHAIKEHVMSICQAKYIFLFCFFFSFHFILFSVKLHKINSLVSNIKKTL